MTDKITKAVKDALNDKRLEDLALQLTNLSTQMTAGFSAIHTRQDLTNGKVIAHQAKFDQMAGKAGYDKLIWLLLTTLVGVIVYMVKL